ncbi:MAG: PilZ domain-containing protein [Candidatus Aminicenantes bacterium]|nr:PilZ domain-containing protein [Candidatus Aminicenantes bacterium]
MPDNIFGEKSFEQTVKETGFNLSLPTRVEGYDREGNFFTEKTSLSYISHQGSSFWLRTPVSIGLDLKLTVDLPPKLSQDQNLKLIIRGKIIFVEASTDQIPKQRVSIKFENKYLIENDD